MGDRSRATSSGFDVETVPRWDVPRRPTIVVAPHPDDETLGAGGLIARQRQRGCEVTVIAVTDGEASHAGTAGAGLAQRRRRELERAVAALGAGIEVVRLGLPDGDLSRRHEELVSRLEPMLGPQHLVVGPSTVDHHADHLAVARALQEAAAGKAGSTASYFTWAHLHPPASPPPRLVSLELSDDERARRRSALAEHRSQLDDAAGPAVVDLASWRHLQSPIEFYALGARS